MANQHGGPSKAAMWSQARRSHATQTQNHPHKPHIGMRITKTRSGQYMACGGQIARARTTCVQKHTTAVCASKCTHAAPNTLQKARSNAAPGPQSVRIHMLGRYLEPFMLRFRIARSDKHLEQQYATHKTNMALRRGSGRAWGTMGIGDRPILPQNAGTCRERKSDQDLVEPYHLPRQHWHRSWRIVSNGSMQIDSCMGICKVWASFGLVGQGTSRRGGDLRISPASRRRWGWLSGGNGFWPSRLKAPQNAEGTENF